MTLTMPQIQKSTYSSLQDLYGLLCTQIPFILDAEDISFFWDFYYKEGAEVIPVKEFRNYLVFLFVQETHLFLHTVHIDQVF